MAKIQAYKLKNGEKRYKFQIFVGTDPLTGKPKTTTRRGFKTKKEAQLEMSRLQLEIDKGTFKPKSLETFQDVYDLWIVQYEQTVKESTFVKTKEIFKNHILPALGSYRIDKISVQICQKHVNEWFRKMKSFRKAKTYASKVLDYAVSLGMITDNVMKRVIMPVNIETPQEGEKINFYSKEELIHFLKCAEDYGNYKAYALFRLLAFSGMRKGEALALTWNDINFKTNEIRINKALSRGKNNRLYTQTTKTSVPRTIKMDGHTMKVLQTWKTQQKQDSLKLGFNTLKPDQLIFNSKNNGFLQPSKTRKWIVAIQEKYGLTKITTHGLRHTHCSLLFEAGATIKEVQDRLGHKDAKTTMNIYAHVTEKSKDETIQKFTRYMDF